MPFNLDADGPDELMSIREVDPGHHALAFITGSGTVVEQLNYSADAVQPPLQKNLDGLGPPELLVPVIRNDSMFISVADATGRKLYTIFLIDGEPRVEPDGILPWDPSVRACYLLDVNADGRDELISIVATAYARLPRGILIHSLPDGRLLDRIIVGADLVQTEIGDYDGDGEPEILAATRAVNNGAEAGGVDDAHSYLLLFEITPALKLTRSRLLGDRWQRTSVLPTDWDGDGDRDLLTIVTDQAPEPESRVRLELLDANTWQPLWQRSIDDRFVSPLVLQVDRDPRPEMVFLRPPGEIVVVDDDFEIVTRRKLPAVVDFLFVIDFELDGLYEIGVALAHGGVLFLGTDLTIQASYPGGQDWRGFSASQGSMSLLAFDGANTIALEWVPNPWFWVYRYGRPAGAVAAAGAAASVLIALAVMHRRNRMLETITTLSASGRSDGVALLDQRGAVRWTNESAKRCLGPVRNLADLERRAPELAAFCRESIAAHPPKPRSLDHAVEIDAQAPVRVAVEPVLVKTRGDPHWVVRLAARDRRAADESQAWIMMAQRVAHSLKNPLTSILLSLQRLQMDYREMAPAVANRLDRYATRIEGRIDELRALTSNFLKFVNLEQPAMRTADLADLVRRFAETRRRSMPPDIQLEVRTDPDVPLTALDHEQIEALLDNLIANAINAMPDGGRVTLSVKALRDIQVGGAALGDYVVLEVADTGTGIPEEIKPRLFEAGFTTAEDGWGLGLAIVRKIVTDHGGALEVESDVGVGSVFSVLLPVRGSGPSSASHAHRPEQQEGSMGGASGET